MSTVTAPTAPATVSVRQRERIRVMVVDDAVVVRVMIARWIETEPDMQVVASLGRARLAIDQLERNDPDVVILDVSMPDMDGITALPLLLEKKPSLVVLMVSTLTRRNAEISLHSLSLGAADYIPKPESGRELRECELFRRDLIEKIRALAASRKFGPGRWDSPAGGRFPVLQRDVEIAREGTVDVEAPGIAAASHPEGIVLRSFAPAPPRVLLIGASTGGPQALNTLVGAIGKVVDQSPVLITQHMPRTFTTILAEHLARTSGRSAAEAKDGELIRAGHIYIAPGGLHMRVARRDGEPVIALDDGPPVHFCKPAGRSVLCLGGCRVGDVESRADADRNGVGWRARCNPDRRGRRCNNRSGRGFKRCLGNAWSSGPSGSCVSGASA